MSYCFLLLNVEKFYFFVMLLCGFWNDKNIFMMNVMVLDLDI